MRTPSIRLALVAAALATTGLVAQASSRRSPGQEAPAQGRPAGGQRGDMYKNLNLNDEQKTKLDALMREKRANGGGRQGQQGPPSDADH